MTHLLELIWNILMNYLIVCRESIIRAQANLTLNCNISKNKSRPQEKGIPHPIASAQFFLLVVHFILFTPQIIHQPRNMFLIAVSNEW